MYRTSSAFARFPKALSNFDGALDPMTTQVTLLATDALKPDARFQHLINVIRPGCARQR
jgi:hypothetical protein